MPNNTINWGQGAANNSIGWGQGATNNTRDWGWIHSRSYGHDETNLVGDPFSDYRLAVLADGGVIESRSCTSSSFASYTLVSISLFTQAEAYQTAVLAESGSPVVESFSCLRNSFTELNNVAT